MKIESRVWTADTNWTVYPTHSKLGSSANLALVFASRQVLERKELLEEVRHAYPEAHIVGCSTAGEIHQTDVYDDSMVVTAVQFEKVRLKITTTTIDDVSQSEEAARILTSQLPHEDLCHVMVFSEGLRVNGSELVRGMVKRLPADVAVTGGLAGDGAQFVKTVVCTRDKAESGRIVAIAFYGKDHLRIGYGSVGGWDSFGPERLITRSSGNVLYELENKSALGLYKEYLGEAAADLPLSALLFPLSLRPKHGSFDGARREGGQEGVVRTILAIDEKEQSMTFAGDVPEGHYARFMKANFDRLIEGASGSALISRMDESAPDLAVLISCVGRKLVLKQRVEEEVEAVREVLGERTAMTGFYSYGEISPFTPTAQCELHNQTMTITTFTEH